MKFAILIALSLALAACDDGSPAVPVVPTTGVVHFTPNTFADPDCQTPVGASGIDSCHPVEWVYSSVLAAEFCGESLASTQSTVATYHLAVPHRGAVYRVDFGACVQWTPPKPALWWVAGDETGLVIAVSGSTKG